ncbi:NOL1/NOP2/sun family-domain-containing protein [Massariosphaeria phaeospora]|uniref:Nucleolar protein 2 n=1 Tax=Massariosphaeria phaeospora TaxID=100035 RepID=A0A7C8I2D2_9PLEO|nr:NOL1/NOP2/sun family-domain-containing protein [Massariosphaeria phaeospora]
MGQGRRMKKQGMPGPLDESLVTRKRKDAPPAPVQEPSKRRRRGQKEAKKNAAAVAVNGRAGAVKNGRPAKKLPGKKFVPPPVADDEIASEDDADAMEDAGGEVKVTGLDALGSASEDDDEFAASGSDGFDSDSEVRKTGMWSDDEDDDAVEEQLTAANIEGLTRKLDMQKAVEEAEAQAELEEAALQTNIAGDKPKVLDDEEDEEGRPITNLGTQDLQLLRQRISDTIRVLDDFKTLAEDGKSRVEYRTRLLKDICAYYGYSEFLADKFLNLFPAREAFAFFEANETPRPIVIRTNGLRTSRRELAQALINRGVQLEPVGKWSKVGLQIFESQVPLGATPEYLAGHYILQAASSFLPVMALAPQEHERVLDMAAAPGGKTTHIAALMKNTGCIFANDANKDRSKGLIGNISRLGVSNVIVSNYSALEFPRVMGGFDRVLLDAPCSGTGVIAKDSSVKTNKTEADFMRLPHLQKQLILAAIDSVDHSSKTGGYIVYSTCSVTIEENESVVQYALNKRPNVRLVETGLSFGTPGFTNMQSKIFHPSMKLARRYYPHTYNVDGFFVAKFKKIDVTPANAVGANHTPANGNGNANGKSDAVVVQDVVDKTPITEEGDGSDGDGDAFGGWDEDEDRVIMERAERALARRKGRNPKADVKKAKVPEKKKSAGGEAEGEKGVQKLAEGLDGASLEGHNGSVEDGGGGARGVERKERGGEKKTTEKKEKAKSKSRKTSGVVGKGKVV